MISPLKNSHLAALQTKLERIFNFWCRRWKTFFSSRSLSLWIGVLVVLFSVFIRYQDPFPTHLLRLKVFDFYQTLKPREPLENSPVVIADIDEYSIKKFGQWPWSRDIVAQMLVNLDKAGANVVGFDVLFSEQDRSSPSYLLSRISPELLEEKGGEALRSDLKNFIRSLPSHDVLMAQAMTKIPTVVGQAGNLSPTEEKDKRSAALSRSRSTSVAITLGGNPVSYIERLRGGLYNLPLFERVAAGRGVVSLNEEIDGFVRRVPIIMEIDGVIKPSFSTEILRVALGGNSFIVVMDAGGIYEVLLQTPQKDYIIPTDIRGRIWVYFASPDQFNSDPNSANPSARWYISAASIVEGTIPPERLKGRMVLLGTSATGLLDLKSTAIAARMPGVEVHVNILENILSNQALSYPYWMKALEMFTLTVTAILQVVLLTIIGPLWTMLVTALTIGGAISVSWFVFVQYLTFIDVTFMILVSLLLLMLLNFTNFARNEAEKNRVRRAFNQYLTPDLVEDLAASPDKLRLGGEKREMTILFSDIRNFTKISESLSDDPISLTDLINDILTPQTSALLESRATIDKYIGDCIMAFWNAPINDPNHEINACNGALNMIESLETFSKGLNVSNRSYAQRLEAMNTRIKMGIGVCTGIVVVGNMGSQHRFNYSVLGDSVNIAARLEGQTKYYGVPIILAEQTAMAVNKTLAVLKIDNILLVGKQKPMVIYCLLGDNNYYQSPEFADLKQNHEEFMHYYTTGLWQKAQKITPHLTTLGEAKNIGRYYTLMEQRMKSMNFTPPDNFDGVFVSQNK